MTYLIATRAGNRPAEAAVLAQAAQEIDDNHIPIAVSKGTPAEYEDVIPQTMDILRPRHNEPIQPAVFAAPSCGRTPPSSPCPTRRSPASGRPLRRSQRR